MADRTRSVADAARVVRFWQAVEIFSPQPLPKRDAGQRVADFQPGEPMPWEPGSRLGEEPIGLGLVWRHEVFGGVYPLSRLRDVMVKRFGPDDQDSDQQLPARGQSALFACTLDGEGRPVEESAALSMCAWALGRLLADGQTIGAWLSGFDEQALRYACDLGKLAGLKVDVGGKLLASGSPPAPDLPGAAGDASVLPAALDLNPLTSADLQRFTAELAERLGVTGELSPRGLRIRSYRIRANRPESPVQNSFLTSSIAADFDRVATALLEDGAGASLAAYLMIGRRPHRAGRVDVRATPAAVWAGCMPARFPLGRWVSNTDHALAFSQQFAVNEVMHQLAEGSGLVAVNGPPGTGKTTMLRDLIAAIVVERALRLTELDMPGEAFSGTRVHKWQAEKMSHTIVTPRRSLTGFEMVVASANNSAVENVTTEIPGPEGIGSQWRDQADALDYFASTAELTCGEGAWGLIAARLGNAANRRAFSQGFWWGSSQRGDNTAAGMKDVLQVLAGS